MKNGQPLLSENIVPLWRGEFSKFSAAPFMRLANLQTAMSSGGVNEKFAEQQELVDAIN